jgi:hypothetical protein
MKSLVARRALTASVLAAFATAACHVLIGVEDEVGDPRPAVPDSSVADAGGPVDPCKHAAPPARPDAQDDGQDAGPLYFALKTLSVPQSDAGVGYDLDGLCTCDKRPGVDAASSCVFSGPDVCDGPEGIDNALSDVTGSSNPSTRQFGYEEGAENGYRAVLFRLSGYNGTSDDPKVTLAVLDVQGVEEPSPCNGGEPGDAADKNALGGYKPAWLGCDSWRIPKSSLAFVGTNDEQPKYIASDAWVTGGRLVARFKDGILVSTSGANVSPPIALNQTILSARVVRNSKTGDRLEDGFLSARVDAENLLSVIGNSALNGTTDQRVCDKPDFDFVVRPALCSRRDLVSPGRRGDKCDSLSAALVFSGVRVRPGALFADEADAGSRCDAAAFVCP